jgi:hypothetical protein
MSSNQTRHAGCSHMTFLACTDRSTQHKIDFFMVCRRQATDLLFCVAGSISSVTATAISSLYQAKNQAQHRHCPRAYIRADTQFPREISSSCQQKGERGDDQIEYVKRQTARFQTAAAEFRGCLHRPES